MGDTSGIAIVEVFEVDKPEVPLLNISTRGPVLTGWRDTERLLAGFPDGKADEGPSAGPASLLGLEIAHEHGWHAPASDQIHDSVQEEIS